MGDDTMMVSTAFASSGKPLEAAKSPGPIYLPKYSATLPTSPRVVFSGSMRNASSKSADTGPGPGAYTLGGREWDKTRACSIRGREKFGSSTYTTAVEVPGPGEYPRVETSQTTVRNSAKYSIRGRPIQRAQSSLVPAPNAHQHPESITKFEYVAKLTNAPRVVFGKPPRKRAASSSAAALLSSPGPAEYSVDAGYSTLSTIKSTPAYSMIPRRNAGEREKKITPEFHDPITGVGKQVLSYKKTAPAITFSGRVKFGSPYM